MLARLSKIENAIADLHQKSLFSVLFGTVEKTDGERSLVDFDLGFKESIKWLVDGTSNVKIWNPPRKGERVVVLNHNGNIDEAIIIGSTFSERNTSHSNNLNTLSVKTDEPITFELKTKKSSLSLSESKFEAKVGDVDLVSLILDFFEQLNTPQPTNGDSLCANFKAAYPSLIKGLQTLSGAKNASN